MRNIPYASAVGNMMYAMLCTRPDICYSNKELHARVWYTKDLILTGYTDSDFQTDKDARKSTSESVFTLNEGAVVWRSVKKTCISDFITEGEYVAACKAANEAEEIATALAEASMIEVVVAIVAVDAIVLAVVAKRRSRFQSPSYSWPWRSGF
ncbi:gag/pol protein [Cucumis melo var. makuwa]|uniref:Gag/pol protein n=1 Tax=Cucumis melo var. makuwa TaxID=1194695 RepID=A0A5A7UZU0_CUCMM|nr:gag/pol protein [Cucumis melo var. makuwa]